MDSGDQATAQGGDSNVKKRRGKGEAGEGNYVCGCGKAYLSYPALYTHIKTKHDGVTPLGTTQPQASNKSGRGRPKVYFSSYFDLFEKYNYCNSLIMT